MYAAINEHKENSAISSFCMENTPRKLLFDRFHRHSFICFAACMHRLLPHITNKPVAHAVESWGNSRYVSRALVYIYVPVSAYLGFH
jgi:hypothetical protein